MVADVDSYRCIVVRCKECRLFAAETVLKKDVLQCALLCTFTGEEDDFVDAGWWVCVDYTPVCSRNVNL